MHCLYKVDLAHAMAGDRPSAKEWMVGDPVRLNLMAAGNTFAPEGEIFEQLGSTLQHPTDQPSLLSMAQCAALCNDSSLQYAVGEAGSRLGFGRLLSWWLHARLVH